MGKFAQRVTAQDMIRANAEAEAAQMDRIKCQAELMKKQLEQYDLCMQEMCKLNMKNAESAQLIQDLAKSTDERAEAKLNELTAQCIAKIDEIQAANKDNEEVMAKLGELQGAVSELKTGTEEAIHKENVKVYRNVQAVVVEELEKQSKELILKQENLAKSNKAIIPIVIISMIAGLANVALFIVWTIITFSRRIFATCASAWTSSGIYPAFRRGAARAFRAHICWPTKWYRTPRAT